MRDGGRQLRYRLPVLAVFVSVALFLGMLTAFAADFTDSTSLTINRTPSGTIHKGHKVTIFGKLHAKHAACRSNKTIHLFRKNKGQAGFHEIDSTLTNSMGSYSFVRHP